LHIKGRMMREGKGDKLQEKKQVLGKSVVQSAGSTLLWVLILLVLGGMYLAVNSKAASAGRAYLEWEEKVEDADQRHSDLVAQHAFVTSPQRMLELAQALGFRLATLKDVIYISTDRTPLEIVFRAPHPEQFLKTGQIAVSPAYTETLLEALRRWLGIGGTE
jgi:cell division protein FtsL